MLLCQRNTGAQKTGLAGGTICDFLAPFVPTCYVCSLLCEKIYPMPVLLIDNYDSFTYNLSHLVQLAGAAVVIMRNDAFTENFSPWREYSHLLIGPGPGSPQTAGKCLQLIARSRGEMPILGVCLGMQCINEVYGGITVSATRKRHGQRAAIRHDGSGIFRQIKAQVQVGLYHSLMVVPAAGLVQTATCEDNIPMAVADLSRHVYGVQFHPESFLSKCGREMLVNFLHLAVDHG
jgi:anthranilate synthase component 2